VSGGCNRYSRRAAGSRRNRAGNVQRSARFASLIETAKVNGVEPFAYLKATLEEIASGYPQRRIDDLLPWNFQPSS